ncbi:MAG TPA: CvpA family protein [Planctomycetaceae bacterium]
MDIGLIDFLIVAVIALVTWCVAAEGAVGAGTIFFAAVLSGLVAMNFFEPLADALDGASFIGERADMIALLGLFGVFVTLARLAAERISPTFISLQGLAYDVGRWGFGFLTGYLTAAILLTALHTAPLPREFWGFRPERNNLFGAFAPDRQWIGFVQYVTEKPFARRQSVPHPVTGEYYAMPRVFDGRTAFHWGDFSSARVVEESQRVVTGSTGERALAEAAGRIVIPSFLARYADRRERLSGPPAEAAPAAPPTAAPTGGPSF